MLDPTEAAVQGLKSAIASTKRTLQELEDQLAALETGGLRPVVSETTPSGYPGDHSSSSQTVPSQQEKPLDLALEEYKRYGRQMIIPGFGRQGQLILKNARVLIVGVGGLGCPAAAYLAGAGVGKIGLVDGDRVEISNLHRQIIHTSNKIGQMKVESAVEYLRQLNPIPTYLSYPFNLSSANALEIFSVYDVILDCTDQPQSRYLISDAALILQKPLVTASATITQGQLMTFGNRMDEPCYRCVFPKPPSPETVQSCSDSGILGPAVGVMGVLMASEVIKMLTQCAIYEANQQLEWEPRTGTPTLLLYSAYDETPFRTSFLRTKPRKDCPVCSGYPSITYDSFISGSLDYAVFCGLSEPVKILPDWYRCSAKEFHSLVRGRGTQLLEEGKTLIDYPDWDFHMSGYIMVDVREKQDFDMCHIEGSLNLPYSIIDRAIREPGWLAKERDKNRASNRIWQVEKQLNLQPLTDCYIVCRYGNDSQRAVDFFLNNMNKEFKCFNFFSTVEPAYTNPSLSPENGYIRDIEGGLKEWSKFDPTFPEY